MDITPIIPQGKNIIKAYGNLAFKINDQEHSGNIILLPDRIESWAVKTIEVIEPESLQLVAESNVEILLIGCGEVHMSLTQDLHRHFMSLNIGVEIMTTGAACRTYNVLLAEGRDVAAALVAV